MIKICLGWLVVDLVFIIIKVYCLCDFVYLDLDIQYIQKILDNFGFVWVIVYVRKGNYFYFDSKRNNYIVISQRN